MLKRIQSFTISLHAIVSRFEFRRSYRVDDSSLTSGCDFTDIERLRPGASTAECEWLGCQTSYFHLGKLFCLRAVSRALVARRSFRWKDQGVKVIGAFWLGKALLYAIRSTGSRYNFGCPLRYEG